MLCVQFELLMMGGITTWNIYSIDSNKECCITLHLVGYIWRNPLKMHGAMNVKLWNVNKINHTENKRSVQKWWIFYTFGSPLVRWEFLYRSLYPRRKESQRQILRLHPFDLTVGSDTYARICFRAGTLEVRPSIPGTGWKIEEKSFDIPQYPDSVWAY